jgi:hypothetical protein
MISDTCDPLHKKGVDKIVLIDPIVLYSIDIETGMVVAKSTT